jgi:signal transduction histidine kinase/CheY-like chemotaxis protein
VLSADADTLPFGAYVSAALVTALCAALLFAIGRRGRINHPLLWWALAMALSALGLALVSVRALGGPPAGPFVSLLGHSALGMAFGLLSWGAAWTAARAFTGRPVMPLVALSGAVAWLVVAFMPGTGLPSSARLAIAWAVAACYAFGVLVVMLPDGQEDLPARGWFLVLNGLCGVVYLVRAVLSATGLDDAHPQEMMTATAVVAQLRAVGISFLALALTKERAELMIARARDAARDAGEARRRFLTQMSHEVRTPLNGVLGLAQVLLHDRRLTDDQRHHVTTLDAAGRHLLAIVNDALDLAQIDAGQMTFAIRPFDLHKAVAACLDLIRPSAEDKHIRLELEQVGVLPARISGDTTRLRQVLINLLWNALKFTPAGGVVTLRVGAGTDWMRCEVIDTGPGIPAEKQALLFHDFTRLDPNRSDGTGLGLAISARLVERMGGRLTYLPGPNGVGSLFRMQLPWSAADEEAGCAGAVVEPAVQAPARSVLHRDAGDDAPVLPAARSDGLRLLVVDDVAANRVVMRALLTADAHSVVEAGDGAEAVDLVGRERFDCVLMDVRMPVMDGLEATRRIRGLPGAAGNTPVIAVSADVMPETLHTCAAAGMNAVIAKPVDRQALMHALRRLNLAPDQRVAWKAVSGSET